MASPIHFTETAAKAQEARRLEMAVERARKAAKASGSKWARFWRWMNKPLW
jgi:hypothetical protein